MSLIVLTAFGEPYCEMASLCVRSLRRQGFAGNIVALTDAGVTDAICVHMEPSNDKERMAARMEIPERLSLDGVGRLWYLDCDILATGPWELIENELGPSDLAVFAQAATTKIGNPFVSACLTPEELEMHAEKPAVNSGVVGFNLTIKGWAKVWNEWRHLTTDRMDADVLDESAPNALAIRHGFKHIDKTLIHYPGNPESDGSASVLHHFAGMSVDNRLDLMRS